MTEDRPEYLADALEMIGPYKPKEIIHEISGWTPLFDVLVSKYSDPVTPLVFGKAWRFCQMEDGVCKASLSTMAGELGMDESTVSRHLKILVSDGYLVDLTPDLRNKPHIYAETGRIVMRTTTNAGLAQSKAEASRLAQSNVGVAHSKATVAQNAMTKVLKKDSEERKDSPSQKKGDAVDLEIRYFLSPKAIQEAIAKFFKLTPNWEAKYNRQFMEWAVETKIEPVQIERAADLWRSDKRFNWQAPSLRGIQEHWFELVQNIPLKAPSSLPHFENGRLVE